MQQFTKFQQSPAFHSCVNDNSTDCRGAFLLEERGQFCSPQNSDESTKLYQIWEREISVNLLKNIFHFTPSDYNHRK